MGTILKNFTRQAKNLITLNNPQVEKERNQLLTKLSSLGLLGKDAKIEDVLSLTLKDVLERRLQTLVYRKNMAGSLKQARQFIVHDHISLGERTITAPSYLVPLDEEGHIQFSQGSVVADPSHPIRVVAKVEKKDKKEKKEVKEEEKKTKVEGKKAEKGNKTASEKKSEVRKEIKGKKAEVKED